MKINLFILTLFSILTLAYVSVSQAFSSTQFCSGFERGYITGYKRASSNSLDPLVPLCPLQPLKKLSDPESDFEHGYVIGFAKGMGDGGQY